MAGLVQDRADDLMVLRQVALETGDGRVGVGELLQNRLRPLERCQGCLEISRLVLEEADVVVALCQVALELRDFGVGFRQPLTDGPGPFVRRQCKTPVAARALMAPMSWSLTTRSVWN